MQSFLIRPGYQPPADLEGDRRSVGGRKRVTLRYRLTQVCTHDLWMSTPKLTVHDYIAASYFTILQLIVGYCDLNSIEL